MATEAPLSRVRAKFYVSTFSKLAWGGFRVEMKAVYRKDDAENSKFWDATPSGTLTLDLSKSASPEVVAFYEWCVDNKREVYLDFTPSGEPHP